MTLSSLLEQLVQDLELPMPEKDARGRYQMVFEDQIVVFDESDVGLTIQAELGQCQGQNLETFFSDTLLANLFGQGTGGAILGLTPDGKSLTLSLTIEYNVEYKDFRDLLEDFLNAADVWRTEALKISSQ